MRLIEKLSKIVTPAKAGVHEKKWIPAFAGMTLLFSLLPLMLAFSLPALAQTFSIDLGGGGGADGGPPGTVSGRAIQLIALITILSLAPSILMMMTSFIRIVVVLSFLRTAIGLQQTPPNSVMISLALFLTFFIMAPTLEKAYTEGLKPFMAEEIDELTAFDRTVDPFKSFMLNHARVQDIELFLAAARMEAPKEAMQTPLHVLIPAFMISELKRAFEIGFMLFLPFLIIDMVTASILMSMGMMMLPPVAISLPFKIIFFVMVDGWHLVAGSLIQSFTGPVVGG